MLIRNFFKYSSIKKGVMIIVSSNYELSFTYTMIIKLSLTCTMIHELSPTYTIIHKLSLICIMIYKLSLTYTMIYEF